MGLAPRTVHNMPDFGVAHALRVGFEVVCFRTDLLGTSGLAEWRTRRNNTNSELSASLASRTLDQVT
jgi:hypothetical protein